MVKELDLQLALGMNERRKIGSLPAYDIMHRWGVSGQTEIGTCLFHFIIIRSFPLQVEHLMGVYKPTSVYYWSCWSI